MTEQPASVTFGTAVTATGNKPAYRRERTADAQAVPARAAGNPLC